ncbi:MAG: hypothetical protein GVY17_11885 [Cyanobacteria bacterium]|jgi:hypothetical protein|nr:hypothetical protein [Cyanobacteria bacterium GSL.Bin21]
MKDEEISELIPKDRLGEFASSFLQEFLKDGFGATSKRSTELHVFHLLNSFGNLDSFDNTKLSHLFQITETRVKGYRYESKLRFPPEEEKYIERRILWSLAKSEFDGDVKRIKFIIEDPYVRKSLSAESKRLGGVPDTSFNSEIVSLRTDQLLALISKLFGQEIADDYKKDFDELNKEDSKVKFTEVRKKFVLGAAGALGGGLVKSLKASFTGDPT